MEKIWNLDAYRKAHILINEYPRIEQSEKYTYELKYKGDKSIAWFNGIICVELLIAPRVASNYAMLNMEFTENDSEEFVVQYKVNKNEGMVYNSEIASSNDEVKEGIDIQYLDCLNKLCGKIINHKLPSGILVVSGGACGKIGTSVVAIGIVFNIMIKIFSSNFNELDFDNSVKSLMLEECKTKIHTF